MYFSQDLEILWALKVFMKVFNMATGISYCLFDLYGFKVFFAKVSIFSSFLFFFILFNSFCRRTVKIPNTSDVGKHQIQI